MKKLLLMCMMAAGLSANAQIIASEGFESGSIPAPWTSSGFSASTAASTLCTGTNTARINLYSFNPAGNLTYASASSNGQAIAVGLKYGAQPYDASSSVKGTLTVEYSVNGGTSYTQLGNTVTLTAPTTNCNTFTATIPASTVPVDSNFRLRIRGNNESPGDWFLSIDDISLTQTASCFPPSAVTATAITTNSATIGWTAPSTIPSGGYQVYYTASATAPLSTTTPTVASVTGTSTNISSLTSGTVYYVYVRSSCGSTTSAWTLATTFTTLCVAQSGYTQNFDTTPTGSSTNNNAPVCWKYLETNGSTGIGYVYNSGAYSPSNCYYLYNDSDVSGNIMLIAPETTNLASGTKRVKFYAKGGGAGYTMQVGRVTNSSDASTYTSVSTITLTDNYVLYTVNIPAGAGNYIAFKHGQAGTYQSVYIDDVVIEDVPSCVEPSALVSTGASLNSVTVSWTAATTAPANGYQLYFSTSNTAPTSSTVLNASNSLTSTSVSATISSLTANTTYYVWVRSVCSATGQSTWVGPLATFTGACLPTGGASSTSYYLNAVSTTGASTNASYTANAYSAYVNTNTSVTSYPGGTFNYSLSAAGGSTYYYYIWVDLNNDLDFNDTGETIIATTSYSATNSGTVTLPTTLATGTYRMRTAVSYSGAITPCGPAPYGNYVDFNLVVGSVPSCLPVNVLTVASVTPNSASLTWTAPSPVPANGYQVYYSTTNTAPTSATVLTSTNSASFTTNSGQISGLNPATTYYVWVRSVCTTTASSTWSASATFTTLCTPSVVPYSLNFNSVTAPALPGCVTTLNVGTGNNWETAANPTDATGFTGNVLRYAYNFSNAANTWFFTQGLTLTAGTQYTIAFKYAANSTNYTEKMKVAYGTSATVAGMANVLANYSAINFTAAASASINFTPTVTGVYYFGFNAYSDANQYNLYLDDISVTNAVLATSETTVSKNNLSVYPNPFSDVLNISNIKNVKSLSVVDVAGRVVKSFDKPTATLQLSELSSGMYVVVLNMNDGTKKSVKVIKK